jgi:hypothetical protein
MEGMRGLSGLSGILQRAPTQLVEALRLRPSAEIEESRDDIEIVRAIPRYVDGRLDHYHLRVNEIDERGQRLELHRVVRLITLHNIPQEQRGQATMISRAVSFLQGVYTSHVDLLRLGLGLFKEPYFGIVQVWGVRADSQTYDGARNRSAEALAVLQAGLPGVYEKTRWQSPSSRLFESIRELFTDSRYALVQVGHPAPRETARGPADLDRNTSMLEQALQQVEQVYRGMAALKEDFVHLVMAVRIDEKEIMRLAFANAHELSTVESRISGSTGWHVQAGIPIILSKAVSSSAGVGHGLAENRGQSVAEGQTRGQAHTDGQAHSVVDGEAHTVGRAESWGESHGVSEVHSHAVSVGESHVDSRGLAESHGESHGVSRVESHGVADSVGHSETHGLVTGVSRVESHGVADGVSSGVSDGVTSGWSRGGSHGETHGVSVVDTHGVSHAEGVSHGESEILPGGSRTIGETHGASYADPANPPTTESWTTPATTVTTGETHPNTSPEALAAITGEPVPTGEGATPAVVSPGGEEAEIGQLIDFARGPQAVNPFGGTPPTAMEGGFGVHDTPAAGGTTPLSPEVLQGAAGTVTLPGGTRSVGGNLGIPGGPGVSASESGPVNPTVSVQLPAGQVSESVTTPTDPGHGISVASGGQLTDGHSVSLSTPLGPTVGESHGVTVSDGESHGHSEGVTHGVSDVQNWGESGGRSHGVSSSLSHVESHGVATGVSRSESHTVGLSRGRTVSHGVADGESHGVSHGVTHSEGQADGVSRSESFGVARGSFHSVSHGVTESEAHTVSHAEGHTVSEADTVSRSRSHVEAQGMGQAVSRQQAIARTTGTGVSAGLVPSVGFSRSWQTKDMTAEEYAKVLRVQQQFWDIAQMLGAFWTDSYIFARTPRGRAALESLVVSAFRGTGDGVVTPLTLRALTENEQRYIHTHGFAFSPSRRLAPLSLSPEVYWDATLLTSTQLAALVTPGLFEEGYANTTREAIPKFRFEPGLSGEVMLGHQVSYEREEVVCEAPMRIDVANTHNIGVFGDTGVGKSHLVMWLIYELVKKHDQAAMILDMSTTDRGLVHVLPGQVEVYSLYPGGPNPVPWNPMQVGGRIGPTAHKNAVIESLKTVGGLGNRQTGLLNDVLRDLYLEHGVLTDDAAQLFPETDEGVMEEPNSARSKKLKTWAAIVDAEEAAAVNRVRTARGARPVPVGTPLATLEREGCRALARLRSRAVNMGMLYRLVKELSAARGVNPRDKEAFSGIAQRLTHFNEGPLGAMYSRQIDSVSLNDLLEPGKVVILETGVTPELPEVAKGVLLNLAFMILYMERAYILAQEGERAAQAIPTWVVLEEANKILAPTATAEQAGKVATSAQMETIWRDSRKFGFRGIITAQNPSLIPMPILTNCNTIFAGKLKGADDRKMVISAFARSESGFTDEDYKRFQSSMPRYWFVGLLALESRNWKADPVLFQGLEMPTYAPSDAELRGKVRRFKG